MALQEEMESSGAWLFRYRSYLPLFLAVPMLMAMNQFRWPLQSERLHEYWELVCVAVSLSGLALRCYTVGHTPAGTSGRNTAVQLAESLNTTGIYSIVRHPLYLGNFAIWLGISMFCLSWWTVAVFTLSFWIYYERIMLAEERFLRTRFGERFEAWAAVTPALLPKCSLWKPTELGFSLRNVLRREYSGMMAIVAIFFTLAVIEHWVVEHRLVFEPVYLVAGSLALATYLVLRTLKKHTTLLHVEGR